MLTTDLALRWDPEYEKISRRFHENPEEFADAFARAWFKLTHRDMGPYERGCGSEVPVEAQIWQDPVPAPSGPNINAAEIAELKAGISTSGLSVHDLVWTAWASASTFRGTDKRGGANGGRIRLAPQQSWEANDPALIAKVIAALEGIQISFNKSNSTGSNVSIADLIVLGGVV
jgi:catalase-peroxidase